jgi:hypothetical protein
VIWTLWLPLVAAPRADWRELVKPDGLTSV